MKFVKQSTGLSQWFVCEQYRDGYYILKVCYSEEEANEKLQNMSHQAEM